MSGHVAPPKIICIKKIKLTFLGIFVFNCDIIFMDMKKNHSILTTICQDVSGLCLSVILFIFNYDSYYCNKNHSKYFDFNMHKYSITTVIFK